jgi:signal recognition particle subunit SRP72
VATSARTDLEKAEQYEKKLKPLPGLKGINVESLEKTSGARHVDQTVKVDVPEEVKKQKAKKRKRKPKYPKNFDPANPGPPPDPERWLPKRERSSYRPRRNKRVQVRGAQGSVSKHDASAANAGGASSKASQSTSAKAPEPPKANNKSRNKKSRK